MKKTAKEHIRTMIICAILAATGFVLDRFLGITLPLFGVKSLMINISFVPIFAAGFLYGPVWGALVGGVQDILCVLLVPLGPFMPGITLTTMLAGALAGFFKLLFLKNSVPKPDTVRKKSPVNIPTAVLAVILAVYAAGLFFPVAVFGSGEGAKSLTVWNTLVQTEDYKSVFISLLNALDTGDAAALSYSAVKIADTASTLSCGFILSFILLFFSFVFLIKRRIQQAIISAIGGFVLTGTVAVSAILYIPKALSATQAEVYITPMPYILACAAIIILVLILISYKMTLMRLSLFCLIASVITSVLNSFWISLAYTSVSFWVYLVPRLASALFLSVPIYTALLWLFMNKVTPILKKTNLI